MPVSLPEIESRLPATPKQAPKTKRAPANPSSDGYAERKERALRYASKWPAIAEHDGRSNEGYRHAADLLWDFSLSEADAWDIYHAWNLTNSPAMNDVEERRVFENARRYGKHEPGAKLDQRRAKRNTERPEETQSTFDENDQAERHIVVVSANSLLETEPAPADQILANMFDRGDKVVLIGSSKVRKSFALLQLAESLAAGRDCLGWSVLKACRVVVAQLEIQGHHFHRRVRRMATGLGITAADLGDRLQIINARGLGLCGAAGIRAILEAVRPLEADVICVDPLYKLLTGKENAAEDVKVTLNQLDELAEATGAAIIYVHHDAKGFAGERDIRDRGAGSNVLGRDYDACITLTPHASERDAAVIETLLRDYRPQEPFTIEWTEDSATGGYCFTTRTDITPAKQTSATARKQNAAPFETYLPVATEMVQNAPLGITEFKRQLRTKTGLTRDRADQFTKWALLQPDTLDVYEDRGPGKHTKWIGTREQIAKLKVQGCAAV